MEPGTWDGNDIWPINTKKYLKKSNQILPIACHLIKVILTEQLKLSSNNLSCSSFQICGGDRKEALWWESPWYENGSI